MSDGTIFNTPEQRRRKTIPLRPLLGIHRNVSSTLVPKGAFQDVEGYLPSDTGLIRRYGFRESEVIPPAIVRWDYLDSFIDDAGVKVTYGIGDGKFYELGGTEFIERPNVYPNPYTTTTSVGTTITTSTTSRVVTGSAGCAWLAEGGFQRGDILTVTGLTNPLTVADTLTDTQIRVEELPDTAVTSAVYEIKRIMKPAADWTIQVVRLDRWLFIVTGRNTVMVYSIDTPDGVYTYWEMANRNSITLNYGATNFVPKTIDIFGDRVWTGNIFSTVSDRWYPSRVSWTPILSPLDLAPDNLYADIIDISGEISAIKTLGNLLLLYFEFGIQYGRTTQVPGDTFPVAFDRVETARRGVLQPDAVASAKSGHFYVSTDNVYYISQNLEVTGLANKAKELLFRSDLNKTRYKIQNFFEAEGLAVAASTRESSYEEIWTYSFNTKEWTRFQISADYITIFALGSRLTYTAYPEGQIYSADPSSPCNTFSWDSTRAATDPKFFLNYEVQVDDMANGQTGDTLTVSSTLVPFYGRNTAIAGEVDDKEVDTLTQFTGCAEIYGGISTVSASDRFYTTRGKFIFVFEGEQELDPNNEPIITQLETGDFDLGLPDTYKTFSKLSMRLDNQAPSELVFKIQASIDSGLTWNNICDLTIFEGGKEGRCNFLFTGSAPRFRISSNSVASSFILTEITLDVKLRGKQFGDF